MSKENKGNRPERQLEALAKQALRTSVHTEFYTLLNMLIKHFNKHVQIALLDIF
jgi:hypothetical protein